MTNLFNTTIIAERAEYNEVAQEVSIEVATRTPRAPKPSDKIVKDMQARMTAAFRANEELQQPGVATDWKNAIESMFDLFGAHLELAKFARLVLDEKINEAELQELADHVSSIPDILEDDKIDREIKEQARAEAEAARIKKAAERLVKLQAKQAA